MGSTSSASRWTLGRKSWSTSSHIVMPTFYGNGTLGFDLHSPHNGWPGLERLYSSTDCLSRQCEEIQGHSVFEFNPDESQRLSWLGCQPAACRRDIRMARPPQQPNRGVAKRCHDLGDTATAHL